MDSNYNRYDPRPEELDDDVLIAASEDETARDFSPSAGPSPAGREPTVPMLSSRVAPSLRSSGTVVRPVALIDVGVLLLEKPQMIHPLPGGALLSSGSYLPASVGWSPVYGGANNARLGGPNGTAQRRRERLITSIQHALDLLEGDLSSDFDEE